MISAYNHSLLQQGIWRSTVTSLQQKLLLHIKEIKVEDKKKLVDGALKTKLKL